MCSKAGCKVLVAYNIKYCDRHQLEHEMSEKERYKLYAAKRRRDKSKKKFQDFYSSKPWLSTRDSVISNCYAMDIIEYYRTGRAVQGDAVHHIVPLEDDWSKRLDKDNLIYLTERNHRRIHELYLKDIATMNNTIKLLIEYKKRFANEFMIHGSDGGMKNFL